MKTFLFLALVGFAAAECPNACSGHGTCGAKDSCSCYQNYQGNDCSERTCYFGIAHVDSPKGDLNADGYVSGPLTTVVTGSEVYPWGTTEQFPNADANEGHFYMECSNKGICDRKSGQCDCFDGYTGTACARAACPNDCSGHGTCESIKELAEMRSFDTNEHDAPAARVAGSNNHESFSADIEESYSYNLWDQDKTMGCKCDPVYYGADCSLKKCKYGVDPLFYDNVDGVIRQTTVVHVGSGGKSKGDLSGSFKIVFYDVFGEKYVTKSLNAKTASATDVKLALQALPNGVISSNNQDVTAEQPDAVYVSKQSTASGVHEKIGGIGGGDWENGLGVGLGTMGDHGSEFTITFKSNPGILKSIEIDTRGVTNPGSPDYWVANARQGQFSSRYTTNLGRVQALNYGSKYLFTNTDLKSAAPTGTGQVADNTLVKVGGQEFRVETAYTDKLILDEPYLGASIVPVTVDTGVTAKGAADTTSFLFSVSTAAAASDRIHVFGDITAAKAAELQPGAAVYINGCAMTVNQYTIKAGTGGTEEATIENGGKVVVNAVANTPSTDSTPVQMAVVAKTVNGHDCPLDLLKTPAPTPPVHHPVQRRSDDSSNQNVYKTSGDTATKGDTVGISVARGSASAFLTTAAQTNAPAQVYADLTDSTDGGTNAQMKVTLTAATDPAITGGDAVFLHGYGPFTVSSVATADLIFGNTADATASQAARDEIQGFLGATNIATGAKIHVTAQAASGTLSGVVAGSVLLIGGRRYRVRARAVDGSGVGTTTGITLSETFAGGQLRQVCSACATEVDDTSGLALNVNKALNDIPVGAMIAIGAKANADYAATVTTAVTDADAAIAVGISPNRDTTAAKLTLTGVAAAAISSADDVYMVHGFSAKGHSLSVITEAAAGTTYQYVAQCSNRGSCDAATGLCKCFKGYSNDNCDTQNMLAA